LKNSLNESMILEKEVEDLSQFESKVNGDSSKNEKNYTIK